MNLFKNWYYLAANMTEPEKAMERAVARLGLRYRAQWLFPKHFHIADFVLVDQRVILEVDGPSHEGPKQRRKDLVHTLGLEREGWAVVRCTNEEALEGSERVLAGLEGRVASRPTLPELEALLAQCPVPPPKVKKTKRAKLAPVPPPKKAPKKRRSPAQSGE